VTEEEEEDRGWKQILRRIAWRESREKRVCAREKEKEKEKKEGARMVRSRSPFFFIREVETKRSREREAGAAARGSVRAVRWTEGKMDRELDPPNLPPR